MKNNTHENKYPQNWPFEKNMKIYTTKIKTFMVASTYSCECTIHYKHLLISNEWSQHYKVASMSYFIMFGLL